MTIISLGSGPLVLHILIHQTFWNFAEHHLSLFSKLFSHLPHEPKICMSAMTATRTGWRIKILFFFFSEIYLSRCLSGYLRKPNYRLCLMRIKYNIEWFFFKIIIIIKNTKWLHHSSGPVATLSCQMSPVSYSFRQGHLFRHGLVKPIECHISSQSFQMLDSRLDKKTIKSMYFIWSFNSTCLGMVL